MFPNPLRAFHQVAVTGSIRKASETLQLAPSSVSRQIAVLERQMGTELFARSLRGLVLTHAGELVADYAESVITGFDSLRSDLDDLRGSHRLIHLAMVESIISAGPALAVAQFRERFSNVSFDFTIIPAPAVIQAVRERKCDIGITFSGQPDDAIETVARIPEPIVALVPWGHKLAGRPSLSLDDIAACSVALPAKSFGVRQLLDRTALKLGVKIKPDMESNSFEALRDYVRSGFGVAILPSRAAVREEEAQRAKLLPLDHADFKETTLDLIVLRQRRTPRLIRLFIETLQSAIATGS